MLALAAKIILIGSVAGMGFIVVRKIPVLRSLPRSKKPPLFWWDLLGIGKEFFGEKIKIFEVLLTQKILPKIKKIKKQKDPKQEKPHLPDDYWEKLRKR